MQWYESSTATRVIYIALGVIREFDISSCTPSARIRLLIEIAETIRHAHMRDVRHRDLKPENVIMEHPEEPEKSRPYLSDFDLAWYSTATMMTSEALGTIHYGAPEQLGTPNSPAARKESVDAYSFAMVMFYIFTLNNPQPFDFTGNREGFRRSLKRYSGMLSNEAAEILFDVYRRCSEKLPDDRLHDFREIISRLDLAMSTNQTSDLEEEITWNNFLSELYFRMVGLAEQKSNINSFRTASGRTDISIEHSLDDEQSHKIEIRLYALVQPVMEGKESKQVIQTLNRRLDEALRGEKVERIPGRISPYEVFLIMVTPKITRALVDQTRKTIGIAIDCVERT